jgi:hypothetical protein
MLSSTLQVRNWLWNGGIHCISEVVWCMVHNSTFNNISGEVYSILVFNITFNNISVISWRSVLLVEETRVPRENWPTASQWETLSHNVVLSTPPQKYCWKWSYAPYTKPLQRCNVYPHFRVAQYSSKSIHADIDCQCQILKINCQMIYIKGQRQIQYSFAVE